MCVCVYLNVCVCARQCTRICESFRILISSFVFLLFFVVVVLSFSGFFACNRKYLIWKKSIAQYIAFLVVKPLTS